MTIVAAGLCLTAGQGIAQDRLAFLSQPAAQQMAGRAPAASVPMPRPAPLRARHKALQGGAATAVAPAPAEAAPVRVAYAADPGETPDNPFSWLIRQTLAPTAPATLPTGELKPIPPNTIPVLDRTAVPQIEPRYHVRRVPMEPADLVVMIENKAIKHGVPLGLAHAVIRVESNFDPRLTGRGATIGLMQIKYPTARSLGYTGTAEDLLQPEVNLEWGMRYLAGAHRLGRGDVCRTILKYQAGHRADQMTPHAAQYCSRVKTLMAAR